MFSSTQTQLRNGRSAFKVRSYSRADTGRQPIKKWSVSSSTKRQLSPPPALNLPYHSPYLNAECTSVVQRAVPLIFSQGQERRVGIFSFPSLTHTLTVLFVLDAKPLSAEAIVFKAAYTFPTEWMPAIRICLLSPSTSLFFSLDLQL